MFTTLRRLIADTVRGVVEYAAEIRETCFSVFRREESAAIKAKTFPPIIKILEMRLPTLDADKLAIRDMTEIYLNDFVCGKESVTGILSELHCAYHFQ